MHCSFYSNPVPEFFIIQNCSSAFNCYKSIFSLLIRCIVRIDLLVSRIFMVWIASISVLLRVKYERIRANTRLVISALRYSIRSKRMQMYSLSFTDSKPLVKLMACNKSMSSYSGTGSLGASSNGSTLLLPKSFLLILPWLATVPTYSISCFSFWRKRRALASTSSASILLRMSQQRHCIFMIMSWLFIGK